MPNEKKNFKIIVLGDSGVGKTSMIRQFLEGRFKESYKMTIGTNLYTKQIFLGDMAINLQIWDIAGEARSKLMLGTIFNGVLGAIDVFDVTRAGTFNTGLLEWIDILYRSSGRIPIVIAGNKIDLADFRQVSELEAKQFASKLGHSYLETSAKTGQNIHETFLKLVALILEKEGIHGALENIETREQFPLPPIKCGETVTETERGVNADQIQIVNQLEKLINKPIPRVNQLSWDILGFRVNADKIVGLGLYECELTTIPEIIKQLDSLEELRIYKNRLTSIPEFIFNMESLQILGLGNNQLESIPASIDNLRKLKTLSLKENKIKILPESLCRLESLEFLNLMNNQLKTIPKCIGELKSLQDLDLSGNQLRSIPETFGQLGSLRVLDLSNNELKDLPENFGKLESLQSLNLYFNELRSIPNSFKYLKSLETLNLSYNQLNRFPEELLNLESLQQVGLSSNQLKNLPTGLWRLKTLKSLELEGNPWEGEWREIVKNDFPTIFEICRKRDTITVFCSHAEIDYQNHLIEIEKIAKFLANQKEIYKVYYSEEAIQGGMGFEEFMRIYIPQSHVLMFFATQNSLASKPCQFELQLAIDNQIPIIPVLGPNLAWDQLNQIALSEDTGDSFALASIKGIDYKDDIIKLGTELYEHICKLKRSINLFDKEELQLDQFLLKFADSFNEHIKSPASRNLIKKNLPELNELLKRFKTKAIDFDELILNFFQLLKNSK